jgi:hypothetical protein
MPDRPGYAVDFLPTALASDLIVGLHQLNMADTKRLGQFV